MKFELKNLKIVRALSEETTCFTATLWADGRRVAKVGNRGTGGCNDWRWLDQDAQQSFMAQARAAYPKETFEQEDSLIGRMMSRIDNIARFKRHTKTTLLFRLKGDEHGLWRSVNHGTLDGQREYLRKAHGDKVEMIANDDIEAAVDFDLDPPKTE